MELRAEDYAQFPTINDERTLDYLFKKGFRRGQGLAIVPVMHYAGNGCQRNGSKSVKSVGIIL